MKVFLCGIVMLMASCGVGSQEALQEVKSGPYELTPDQTYTVRDYVSSEFNLPRAVQMHEMTASRQENGIITVCGMADALGQEGPGDAIGYRAYTGMLVPDRDDFIVTKLASSPLDQKVIFEMCRRFGAPIKIPERAKKMMAAVRR